MTKKANYETRAQGYNSYHIQWCEPNDVWPKGGWSVYRITGDEIAKRVIWEKYDVEKGYPQGDVKWRHSWCGYLGMKETFEELKSLIDEDAETICTYVTYE